MPQRLGSIVWGAFLCVAVGVIQVSVWALHRFDHSVWALALVREDGLLEALGATACLLAGVTFVYLARTLPHFDEPELKVPRWPSWALGGLLILMFCEEVSWGQRVLRFATPHWVADVNTQREFNLHNLYVFHPALDFNWLKFAWGLAAVAYLGLLPLWAAMSRRARRVFERRGIPVASPAIGALMLLSFAWYLRGTAAARHSGDMLAGHEVGETFEAVIEVLYLALAVETFFRWQSDNPEVSRRGWYASLAGALLVAMFVSGIGWWTTTGADPQVVAAVHFRRGRFLMDQGDPIAAGEQFRLASEAIAGDQPEEAEIYFFWGGSLMQQRQPEAALERFSTAARLAPKFAEFHYHRGLALLALGRNAEAIASLEDAARLRPDDPLIQRDLARARARHP